MNKINAVRGMFPGPELWTYPQDQTAAAIAALAGQRPTHSGMEVSWSGANSRIMVAKGQAFTSAGIITLAAPAAVDVSAIVRPSAGNYAWLLIVIKNETTERGTIYDYRGTARPEYYIATATPATVLGSPFAARGRDAALVDLDNRPPVPAGAVDVAMILVDATSTWAAMIADSWSSILVPSVQVYADGRRMSGVTEAIGQIMKRGIASAPIIGSYTPATDRAPALAVVSATPTSPTAMRVSYLGSAVSSGMVLYATSGRISGGTIAGAVVFF